MGLCERKSDDFGWVIATYLLALLPWSSFIFLDPIDPYWKPYWQVFLKTIGYVVVSIVPYGVLIPYAVLQGCSQEPDLKELFTAIVAMVASLLHVRRAIRAILALWDVYKLWKDVDFGAVCSAFLALMPSKDERENTANSWTSVEDGTREASQRNMRELLLQSAHEIKVTYKCSVRNVLVSSALVDNEWPGDAPRVPYVTVLVLAFFKYTARRLPLVSRFYGNLGKERVTFSEQLSQTISNNVYPGELPARRAMIAIWKLWMIRRAVAISWHFEKDPPPRIRKYPTTYEISGMQREEREIEQVKIENLHFGEGGFSPMIEKWFWKHRSERIRNSGNQPSQIVGLIKESVMLRMLNTWSLGLQDLEKELNLKVLPHILFLRKKDGVGEDELEEESQKPKVSTKRKEPKALRIREIEKELDKMLTNVRDDLSVAEKRYAVQQKHIFWKHFISEFEVILNKMKAYWRNNLVVQLRNALELPDSSVLDAWIRENDSSDILVPLALLLTEKAERRIAWIDHMCSLIRDTRTFWNPRLEHPQSESSKHIMETGFTISSIEKFSNIQNVEAVLGKLRENGKSPWGDLGALLYENFGEYWTVEENGLRVVIRRTLGSLRSCIENTPISTRSRSFHCYFLPSRVCLRYLAQPEEGHREGVLLGEMDFYREDLWDYDTSDEMTFTPDWGWIHVAARFRNLSKGVYAASIPFLRNDALEDPSDHPTMSSYIEMRVLVKSSSNAGSKDCAWFETEPFFLFRQLPGVCRGGWNLLKCFNIEVENERSDVVIEVSGQHRRIHNQRITLRRFELEPKEGSDNAGPHDIFRSAQKRVRSSDAQLSSYTLQMDSTGTNNE